jgi:hypothetical protein
MDVEVWLSKGICLTPSNGPGEGEAHIQLSREFPFCFFLIKNSRYLKMIFVV